MITGSCGHEIKEGFGNCIGIKNQARDGSREIIYSSVCDDCIDFYMQKGLILWCDESVKEKWMCKEIDKEFEERD